MRDTNACGIFKNKSAINTVFAAFFVLSAEGPSSRIVALLSLLKSWSLSRLKARGVSSSLQGKESDENL